MTYESGKHPLIDAKQESEALIRAKRDRYMRGFQFVECGTPGCSAVAQRRWIYCKACNEERWKARNTKRAEDNRELIEAMQNIAARKAKLKTKR